MTDLRDLAAEITNHLREHFPDSDEQVRQVLALAEEAGEFVGAYRRWAGMARRKGSWADVRAELADVVITAYVTATVIEIEDALEDFRQSLGEPVTRAPADQVLMLFWTVGDFVQAYDRLNASPSLLTNRLAMVVNAAYATARVLDFNLDAAVGEKAQQIFSRGWRDKPAEVAR